MDSTATRETATHGQYSTLFLGQTHTLKYIDFCTTSHMHTYMLTHSKYRLFGRNTHEERSQKVCMHTVTEGVHAYCHRRCAYIQSQKVCIHTITEGVHTHSHRTCAYTQSQKVCIHTVTERVHSHSHRRCAFIQSQKVCIHTVTESVRTHRHRTCAFTALTGQQCENLELSTP